MREGRALRFIGAIPALVLVTVALTELVSVARYDHRAPSESKWQEAAVVVGEGRSSGDLIVFAPSWIDPVGRHYFGQWISVDDAARMDASRYSTIWEVALRGDRASETSGLEPVREWSFGELDVRLFRREPVSVLFDFVEQLGRAAITGPFALRPMARLEEVGFEPHRCVRTEPRPGETVELHFSDVPLGSSLVGYAGLADVFTRRDIRTPGRLQVVIDGTVVADEVVGVESGWRRFEVATQPQVGADVRFRISAEDSKRWVCFAAEARK